MIDYFALALGHGLMAIVLLRLVLRADCDADPLIEEIKADIAADRMATSTAGRNAARRARTHGAGDDGTQADDESASSPQVAKR